MVKFKLIKKIFKKFKIILNINSTSNLEINLKTNLKSILSQSGILDAPIAEDYLKNLLEVFFFDLFNIFYQSTNYNDKINIDNKIFNSNIFFKNNDLEFNNLLKYSFFFSDCIYNLNILNSNIKKKFLKLKKKYNNKIKNINNNKGNNNDEEEEENYISEFRYLNLQLPLYIYIYKKHSKNIFLIYNLISTFFLKKFFLIFWQYRKKNFIRYYKFYLKYYKKIFEKQIFIENNFLFFLKFDFVLLYTTFFFKLTLLHNYKYVYYDFYNYKNLHVNIICLLGNFLSFYKYPEFKRRKINFRRKIRKNMAIESQYI